MFLSTNAVVSKRGRWNYLTQGHAISKEVGQKASDSIGGYFLFNLDNNSIKEFQREVELTMQRVVQEHPLSLPSRNYAEGITKQKNDKLTELSDNSALIVPPDLFEIGYEF